MPTRIYSYIALMMGTAAFVAGCAEIAENEDSMTGGETVITAVIDGGEALTRTCIDPEEYKDNVTGLLWSQGDMIGVFTDDAAGTENACFTNNSSGNVAKAAFTGTINGNPAYAYYPYTEENNGRTASSLTGTVHAEQTFNLSNGLLSDDWKYGVQDVSADGTEGYRFKMKHLFSMVKVSVSADGTKLAGQNLERIILTVTGSDRTAKRINGDFTFNAVKGTYSLPDSKANTSAGTTTMFWCGDADGAT